MVFRYLALKKSENSGQIGPKRSGCTRSPEISEKDGGTEIKLMGTSCFLRKATQPDGKVMHV